MFNRRNYLIICFIYKNLKISKVQYLSDIFQINNNRTRSGRDTISLVVKGITRTKDQLLFSHCISQLWNSLPIDLRNITKYNKFKSELFQFLSNKQNSKNTA